MKTEKSPEFWNEMAQHLEKLGKEICESNGCTEHQHNCESMAYISMDGLLDVCASDYFQGSSKLHAAIPMPWSGTGAELLEAVMEDIGEAYSFYDESESGVAK